MFSSWKVFKRHREVHHGDLEPFKCGVCDYKTGRKDNLSRHVKSKHTSWEMVSTIVLDLVKLIGEREDSRDEVMEEVMEEPSVELQKLSRYEILRNERIAMLQEEFSKRFPNFEQEVASLKVTKKKRAVGAKKKASPCSAPRRSSRGASREEVLEEEVVSEERSGDLDSQTGGDNPMSGGEDGEPEELHEGESVAGEVLVGYAGDEEHSGLISSKFGCLPCGLSFRDTGNLRRHVRLVHEQREIAVQCPRTWCKEEFSILAEMIKHKEVCKLACPQAGCLKFFTKESLFAAHQRAHVTMSRRMGD